MGKHGLRPTPLDEQRRALASDEAEIASALAVARRFTRSWQWKWIADDIEGAALLGLCEAAANYDFGKGVPFHAYVRKRVLWAIHDLLKRQFPYGYRRREFREGSPTIEASGRQLESGDDAMSMVLDADDPIGAGIEYQDTLGFLSRQAGNHRDGVMIRLLYGHAGYSKLKQTAAILGVRESRVCDLHSAALRKIRAAMTDKDLEDVA